MDLACCNDGANSRIDDVASPDVALPADGVYFVLGHGFGSSAEIYCLELIATSEEAQPR